MKHYLTRAQMRELAEIGFNTRQMATHECTEDGIPIFIYPSATFRGDKVAVFGGIAKTCKFYKNFKN